MLLRYAHLQNLQFPFVQANAVIKLAGPGILRFRVRQENFGGAVFKDHVCDIGIGDITDLLGGHDYDCILPAHRLEPILQAASKELML